MLHVTNGDSVRDSLRVAAVAGDLISWRDILHDGPTPAGLNLEEMSAVRAEFLAAWGAGEIEGLRRDFAQRDAALRAAREITLWFEHDLYDQLQLIQILTALGESAATVDLICVDRFPGVERFIGLGQLHPPQLQRLWPSRQRVDRSQTALARRAWQAFCAPEPTALPKFLREADCAALPFLRAALERHLEEFPGPVDGLSRNERQILEAIAAGHTSFPAVFGATQRREAAPYLGDTTLRSYLDRLAGAHTPLLTAEPYRLTDAGRRVLAGELSHVRLNGLDRWLGGVHLLASLPMS